MAMFQPHQTSKLADRLTVGLAISWGIFCAICGCGCDRRQSEEFRIEERTAAAPGVSEPRSRAAASAAAESKGESTAAAAGPTFRTQEGSGAESTATSTGGTTSGAFWFINRLTAEKLAAGSSTTLPVLDQEHSYTVPAITAIIPIGPVPISIEIEVAGRWGLGGEVTAEIIDNPNARFTAAAVVRPRAAVNVVAFAGVGLGPVRVGIAGDLTLISVQVPIETAVSVWQETDVDPRPIGPPYAPTVRAVPYAFEKTFADLPDFRQFGPQYANWFAEWTFGAGARASMLDGRIDVQARVDLGFFSKTFRKKIASWKGIPVEYAFVAETLGDGPDETLEVAPLGGSPEYGPMFELAPYVDPDAIQTYNFARAPFPWMCVAPVLGKCHYET